MHVQAATTATEKKRLVQIAPVPMAHIAPGQKNIFQTTHEEVKPENVLMRLLRVAQPKPLPEPEIYAEFVSAKMPTIMPMPVSTEQAVPARLTEQDITTFFEISKHNTSEANKLLGEGYTVCSLKQAATAITKRREEMANQVDRTSLKARRESLLTQAESKHHKYNGHIPKS